jgi:hypothetical protein
MMRNSYIQMVNNVYSEAILMFSKKWLAMLAVLLVIGSAIFVFAKKPDIKPGDAAGGMPACLADNAALQKAIQEGDAALQGQLNDNAALRAELEARKADEVELKRQLIECTASLSTCLGTCPG